MSLILEALRKSEAERQVGRPPGLLSPAPAAQPRAARRLWIPLVLILLLGVGGGSWWLGRQGVASYVASPALPARPAPANAAPAAAVPAPPADVPTSPTATAKRPEPSAHPVTARDNAVVSPDLAPVMPPPPEAANAVTDTQPAPESTATGDATAMQVPLARIEHMPSSDRARLPALKLSVHLFAEQPERRFAIIDGRRVTDDAKLADDLAVKAIVPEGVLLVFEGRTWLLPRP